MFYRFWTRRFSYLKIPFKVSKELLLVSINTPSPHSKYHSASNFRCETIFLTRRLEPLRFKYNFLLWNKKCWQEPQQRQQRHNTTEAQKLFIDVINHVLLIAFFSMNATWKSNFDIIFLMNFFDHTSKLFDYFFVLRSCACMDDYVRFFTDNSFDVVE